MIGLGGVLALAGRVLWACVFGCCLVLTEYLNFTGYFSWDTESEIHVSINSQ